MYDLHITPFLIWVLEIKSAFKLTEACRNNNNTEMQHNSTLYISPQITRRPEVFVTPPNPPAAPFEGPQSTQSLFFHPKSAGQASSLGVEPPKVSAPELTSVQLSQAERLRLWRHDALMQHHIQTAEFVGNKVLQLTGDANDAFWLAQVYVNSGNYVRAKAMLSKYLDSVGCRYLAALLAVKLEQWEDALDLVGELHPYRDDVWAGSGIIGLGGSVSATGSSTCGAGAVLDGGIKLVARMGYLRGLSYANPSNFERAHDSYKEALLIYVNGH